MKKRNGNRLKNDVRRREKFLMIVSIVLGVFLIVSFLYQKDVCLLKRGQTYRWKSGVISFENLSQGLFSSFTIHKSDSENGYVCFPSGSICTNFHFYGPFENVSGLYTTIENFPIEKIEITTITDVPSNRGLIELLLIPVKNDSRVLLLQMNHKGYCYQNDDEYICKRVINLKKFYNADRIERVIIMPVYVLFESPMNPIPVNSNETFCFYKITMKNEKVSINIIV